ncbi:hypothetical protein BDK51DRAFT_30642 [Blyttiomyces helicus]|uniref:Uncharacterized protein n=1 Tax=Blyttiomyces helicus TaxID=388810 RepID=A0A4P9WAL8_9FUNG|nr:hypothetical protein BDK51DRAFT_30642 [Blyttiomyces helicus]|eukprot:RKO87910.1 hypothetical protein BDK51DRAFT_30642 [Blyttiomyces helicus]
MSVAYDKCYISSSPSQTIAQCDGEGAVINTGPHASSGGGGWRGRIGMETHSAFMAHNFIGLFIGDKKLERDQTCSKILILTGMIRPEVGGAAGSGESSEGREIRERMLSLAKSRPSSRPWTFTQPGSQSGRGPGGGHLWTHITAVHHWALPQLAVAPFIVKDFERARSPSIYVAFHFSSSPSQTITRYDGGGAAIETGQQA